MPRDQINQNFQQVKVDGEWKSFQELRQHKYERIIDETLYIARASEGAISADWVMQQPIFVREKYVKQLDEEMKEREKNLKKGNK